MKKIVTWALLFSAFSIQAFAGTANNASVVAANPLNFISTAPPAPPAEVIKDPYRVLDNKVFIVGKGWVKFWGKVSQVTDEGIIVHGGYTGSSYGDNFQGIDFFVANFPYQVAGDEWLPEGMYAVNDGVFSYKTVLGSPRTIRQLNYGKIYIPPPPTPEQIAQAATNAAIAKADAEVKAAEAKAKALKSNQDSAAKGDVYGLLRMGERYRDGDGVEKDLVKSRYYLHLAYLKGSETASNELAVLPAP